MAFDPAWLALLLPVAAASGWFAARNATDNKRNTKSELTSDYFKGLNYLLNEQPDKAIEVFIKMMEIDLETVEMHLALGNLFRKRGEIERATRIHQNLVARSNLNKDQQYQALYELAQDYYSAGLLDRAEDLFSELVNNDQNGIASLQYLSRIYEGEKEWAKGVAVQKQLAQKLNADRSSIIAHYYCQLAEQKINSQELQSAKKYLRLALIEAKDSARALIMMGEIEYSKGAYDGAIKHWGRLYKSESALIGEVVDRLIDSYQKSQKTGDLDDFIQDLEEKEIDSSAIITYLIEGKGVGSAVSYLQRTLTNKPSAQGIRQYLSLVKKQNTYSAEALNFIESYLEDSPDSETYLCRKCGFKGRLLHWQCPSCKQWDTTLPLGSDNEHQFYGEAS